jgi:glycosyltransferase involved in cell wall biosynthesis
MSPRPRTRVLYVIWSLKMGGAERVVFDLARRLDRQLFEPMVCCLNFKGDLAPDLEAAGVPVFVMDKRPGLDPALVPRLARLMRRQHVDVVHAHLWTSSFWGRLGALVARVPAVVVTEHNLDHWRRPWHLLADRLLARTTDEFLFVSREVEGFYRERLALAPERGQVVHNGVERPPLEDLPDPQTARARLGIPSGPVVGVVGRLEARKGHVFFLEAMARLKETRPGARGLIVGDGVERSTLESRCRQLGLGDTVRIVGFWPDLSEALAALDVFVLPSLMEGHPLAILEAMAAGLPVVATDVGGTAEAVDDGRSGLLVPAGDGAALADAIATLLDDPEGAARMGREARRALEERFSLDVTVRRNEDVYLRCMGLEREEIR